MGRPTIAPYGSWASPIDARRIAEGTITLREPRLEGGFIYWLEHRPMEGGRYVVVRRGPDGHVTDLTAEGFNARSRVHEYGGGSYLPCGEALLFVNFADQRVYRVGAAGQPEPLGTPQDVRYADFVCDARRRRMIAIREDHRGGGEPANAIAALGCADGRDEQVLVAGGDFYAFPRVSPDGAHLAWLTWNHPHMPWDASELWVAPLRDDGSLGQAARVAGGAEESILQPEWSPEPDEPEIYFISDRTGWWNLYRLRDGAAEALAPMEAELARPPWMLAQSSYAFLSAGRILCAYCRGGLDHLAVLDAGSGRLKEIQTPYTMIRGVRAAEGRAVFIGGAPSRPSAVVLLEAATGDVQEIRRDSELEIDEGYISLPEPIEFPTTGGRTAHGLFYAPANRDYAGPADAGAGGKPPLVVMVHGGPTSATAASLRLGIQYYTSRGIAVLDVNYGGSTGYGRAYRRRLYGQWGVVDVDDCCRGALHLAEAGKVDRARLAITGGSAGGYTVLSCLAFRSVFAAGASHFGVSDCEALARETHKFESRYLDTLIGPYPQRRDLYLQRSPIHHVDGLNCPVVFFQGLEDRIVPPDQARRMAEALRAKGLPVALLEFAGEQHGFRRAESIRRALEGELYFFSRIFGFTPAGDIEPIEIEGG
jgi:dipeptidyl aminopeptidase/acylaminoacyl peptidase